MKILLKLNISLPFIKIVFIDWDEKIRLDKHFYDKHFANKRYVLLAGWQFRNSDLVIKYKKDIIHLFQPSFEIYKTLQQKINEYQSNTQTLLPFMSDAEITFTFKARYFYDLAIYEELIQYIETQSI